MVALVTGCAGFIGSHLCESLVSDGHEVIGIDAWTETYPRHQKQLNLETVRHHDSFSLITADLAELDHSALCSVVADVDVIFHLAGEPGVRASWGPDFQAYVRNNIVATQRLLEAVRGARAEPRMILASSSSIYGDAEALPTPEATTPSPRSPYGVTKLSAERLCHAYQANFGLSLIVLRYFSVYGPRQRPDMAFHRFLSQAMTRAPIIIYGDGRQSRDFTFVADIVAATRSAAMIDEAVGGVFNVGSGHRTTVNEVLDLVSDLVGAPLNVIRASVQPGDARETSADINEARQYLGYEPKVGLQEGLQGQFLWCSAQPGIGMAASVSDATPVVGGHLQRRAGRER